MAKPNLVPPLNVRTLQHIRQFDRYLPTAFDDSLSLLEKINKIIEALAGTQDLTAEMVDKWNEVYEWVMNEGLEQAITEQVEKWLEDGTITNIFDSLIVKLGEFIERYEKEKEEFLKQYESDSKDFLDLKGYYTEHEITYHRDRQSNTSYILAKIPNYDNDGNPIRIKVGLTATTYGSQIKTVRDFARREGSSLAINASTFSTSKNTAHGLLMIDGEVIDNSEALNYKYTLGIDAQNRMKVYNPNTNPDLLIKEGYTTALSGFMPLIQNGEPVSDAILNAGGLSTVAIDPHPRTAVCKDANNVTYFFTCTGRLTGEYGMTGKDMIRVLQSHGMVFAFMLDGGGSSTMVEYAGVVNKLSGAVAGDNGGTERAVGNVLYIAKDEAPKPATRKMMGIIGDLAFAGQRHNQLLESARYTAHTWYDMSEYLQNGWVEGGTVGSAKVRFEITANNLVYCYGTVKDGESGSVFLQLPPEIAPMFTTHHLVPGNRVGEIYKVVIGSGGDLKIYNWFNDTEIVPNYVKLDGLTFVINPPNMGKQNPLFNPFGK